MSNEFAMAVIEEADHLSLLNNAYKELSASSVNNSDCIVVGAGGMVSISCEKHFIASDEFMAKLEKYASIMEIDISASGNVALYPTPIRIGKIKLRPAKELQAEQRRSIGKSPRSRKDWA